MGKVILSWDAFYNLAKAYYKYHGNLDIPQDFKTKNGYEENPDGFKLGVWISQQRAANNPNFPSISEEQIERLNEIEMIWNVYEYRWNQKYNLAKAYYDHYGNSDIPKGYKTINGYEENEHGFNLGNWLTRQKSIDNFIYSILNEEQIEKLHAIEVDFIFDYDKIRWNQMYNLAKAYYDHYGNLDIPGGYRTKNGYEEDHDGFNLGSWITRHRLDENNKMPDLNEEQIKKLNDIEMIWDIKEYRWNQKYNLAKAYYEHYGNLDIPGGYRTKNGYEEDHDGFNLGDWIIRQRAYYNCTIPSLSEIRIKKLNDLEMIWTRKKSSKRQQISQTSYNNNRSSSKEKRKVTDDQKVNSLEEALDETIIEYGYDNIPDKTKKLAYFIILHIDSMDKDKYAYKAFTEKNGAREYIKAKGKEALLEEMFYSLPTTKESVGDIYQEYINYYCNKKYKKQKVSCLEEALDETIKDYGYENNSNSLNRLIYCLISNIERIAEYEDACLAFTEKNGAREYIKLKGKEALLEEMFYSLPTTKESVSDIYQEYACNYYNKKYNKEQEKKLVK